MMLRLRRHRPRTPIAKALVILSFTAGDRRRFDLSNVAESCMDLLVDAAYLADDSWSVVPSLTLLFLGVEPGRARVQITINPTSDA
jgi:hypothetical protein